MKIGSWNCRGLGSKIKKDEVFALIMKNNIDFGCIQETKMEDFSDEVGRRIWKNSGFRWFVDKSLGRSGGILSFWDGNKFASSSQWSMRGAVVINGTWKPNGAGLLHHQHLCTMRLCREDAVVG